MRIIIILFTLSILSILIINTNTKAYGTEIPYNDPKAPIIFSSGNLYIYKGIHIGPEIKKIDNIDHFSDNTIKNITAINHFFDKSMNQSLFNELSGNLTIHTVVPRPGTFSHLHDIKDIEHIVYVPQFINDTLYYRSVNITSEEPGYGYIYTHSWAINNTTNGLKYYVVALNRLSDTNVNMSDDCKGTLMIGDDKICTITYERLRR